MSEPQENGCLNCRYFLRYYFKYFKYRLKPSYFGHCENKRISKNSILKFPFKRNCEMWEKAEDDKNLTEDKMLNSLIEIRELLEDFIYILNEEK